MFDRRCVRGLLLLCLAAVVTTLVGCNSPGLVSIQISPSASFFGGPGTDGAAHRLWNLLIWRPSPDPAGHYENSDMAVQRSWGCVG